MSQRKPPQSPPKAEVSIVRSSAAEYLTFVAADGKSYNTQHYSLPAIIAVGYKVSAHTQHCPWGTWFFDPGISNARHPINHDPAH